MSNFKMSNSFFRFVETQTQLLTFPKRINISNLCFLFRHFKFENFKFRNLNFQIIFLKFSKCQIARPDFQFEVPKNIMLRQN